MLSLILVKRFRCCAFYHDVQRVTLVVATGSLNAENIRSKCVRNQMTFAYLQLKLYQFQN